MKQSLRLCSLLLFILFVISMFAACGPKEKPAGSDGSAAGSSATESKGSSDNGESSDSSVVEDEDPNADVQKDFGQKTFTIASLWSGSLNPEYGTYDWGDKLLEHYAELEKKYNCKIAFKAVSSYDQFINDFNAAMLAENYYADIIECQLWQGREWTRKGYFARLDGLESMDLGWNKFIASKTELSK